MKFFDFNRSFGYVMATLLCLVFLGASYFFIYLPTNEKRVEEQRFRTLQNIDRNIHDKMENSISLLNTLLTPYHDTTKGYFTEYINGYSSEKFILSKIYEVKLTDTIKLRNGVDSAINIEVNDATRQITLLLQKRVKDKKLMLQVSLSFSFKQFLAHLLPDLVFDEYLVFSKGKTVYESFPSGISNANEDSLLNIKDGVGGSHVKNITAGGRNYKFFLHPVTFGQNQKWILGGLLSTKRYQKERSQLPAAIVMLMVTVVLGMIVIFPWVKLYQMGSRDRLTLMDGASCIIVTMLLMSLLFFCFFKYNTGFRSNGGPDSKKVLAEKISNAFYDETKKHYDILKAFDSLRVKDGVVKNIVRLQNDDLELIHKYTVNKYTSKNDSTIKADFKEIKDTTAIIKQAFWLDSTGKEVYNWTSDKLNAPLGNYATRNYFKSINENKAFYLNGDTAKKFYLDQVISWTSGTFTSLVSVPAESPEKYVAAMSFTMRSVENAVLPTGYSFAVIDKHGKVLYHSVGSRNLNENIKSEFSDSADIISCIDAGTEGEFTTSYYSKSYSVRISPIQNLPYFIIIFSDAGYKEIRDVEIYSFTFSMMLLFFLYIVLQLSITLLVSSRRSFFKKQLFDTSRTGPKISCHKDYVLSSAVNLLVIILLIVCFQRTSFLQYLFLLLFAVTFISLFITRLLAKRYLKEGKKSKYTYKMIAVYWLLALLVILNICAWFLLETGNFRIVFFIELATIVAGWLLVLNVAKIPENIRSALTTKWNYTHSFSLMTLTGLIITSGIPVAFFYITSYNYEQNLGVRHRQTDYANRILEQPKWELRSDSNQNSFYDTTAVYYDSTWISALPAVIDHNRIEFKPVNTREDAQTIKILGTFRLAISDKADKTNKLFIPYSTDSSVVYKPLFINASADSSVTTHRKTGITDKYLQLNSFRLSYTIPAFFTGRGFLYWLFFIIALVIFYFIIHNIVKKLFCLNLPDLSLWEELDDKLLTNNKLNKFLFVIGLPGAGKLTRIISKLKDQEIKCSGNRLIYDSVNTGNNNVLVADLINIPDKGIDIEKDDDWIAFKEEVTDLKYSMVIINHFEYNIQDEFTNLAKLNLLEQLMLKSKCKIIVLSTIHPVAFLDSINENVKKIDPAAKNAHDLERWHVLLGHYRISIMPITKVETTYKPAWHQLLSSETEYTHFLQDMQKSTLDIARNISEDEVDVKTDELAYKLQVTAHYFYMYIWQSLTKEEKFLLYDLAEDNLVNSYDDYNLTMLIAKGVIINSDGSLRFFNRGFRNFILTAIGNTEAMKIKDRIRENGNWSNLKIPLIIIILAILSFLLISQQEAYSKLLTYIAALSAGVPTVLKIFSLFDKTATKTNT